MKVKNSKWSVEEREEYINLLKSVGLKQSDIAEPLGYAKLVYFQRSRHYYKRVRFLTLLMKKFQKMAENAPVLVTISRSYRGRDNEILNELIHFKSKAKDIQVISPEVIAACARIQVMQDGIFTFVGYNQMDAKALKGFQTLKINSTD